MEKENKFLEYKEKVSKSYLKTVCAFSNYNGGTIVFGVTDDLKVVGFIDPTLEKLKIENQINDSIKPRPDFELVTNLDNTISLIVKKGKFPPYEYDNKTYKRNDTSTIEVSDEEKRNLYIKGANLSFEELPSKKDDLSFSYLSNVLSSTISIKEFNLDILRTLNLYSNETYNNAAELLSDSNSFSGLDIVVYGDNINEFKKRYTLSNISILKQYYDALTIYKDNYIIERIEEGFRKKVELIPFDAFREAIANVIIHRKYEIKANTKVEFYKDKIIINSPGGLTDDMNYEAFISGNFSSLRNPIIANVFHRLNIIEMFATGIKRINESYKHSIVKPEYKVIENCVTFILPSLNSIKLNDNEKKVYDVFKDDKKYKREELEELTDFSKATLLRVLNSLLSKNVIKKEGNSSLVRYFK